MANGNDRARTVVEIRTRMNMIMWFEDDVIELTDEVKERKEDVIDLTHELLDLTDTICFDNRIDLL